MTDTKIATEAVNGPWVAYLADPSGFVYQSVDDAMDDLGGDEEVRIGVARRTAAPKERDGGLRLPGTTTCGDEAYEIECYLDGDGNPAESAAARYAQAQAMALGLNRVSQHEPAPGYPCVNEACGCRKAVTN
ncbi:hypothetical protein JNW88_00225 [Micromonospora sp. ATA32]|nr:hypothetical protein [Micromonospora sp. ATA32]